MENINYKIIDNFLSQQHHNNIKETLIGEAALFPWYFNHNTIDINVIDNDLHNFQFTHKFYIDNCVTSQYFNELIYPVLQKLNVFSLLRVKANLNVVKNTNDIYGWHTDYNSNKHKTAIYYVNTNNGKTLLKNNENEIIEIESIENRIVVFDGNIQHTGTSCTDQKNRCVINFNYIEG